jgi:S-formylglutathione hydrolase FrmB
LPTTSDPSQVTAPAEGPDRLRRLLTWLGDRWLTCWRRLPIRVLIVLFCAGLFVAGALGVARYASTYWLYRGFPAPRVPGTVVVHQHGRAQRVPVIPVSVRQITIRSRALGGYPDQVQVVLPPGYASHPTLRYPAFYLLIGSPGEPSNFLTIGQLGTAEAELVAAGRMRPLILVFPAGGRSFFADEEWVNGVHHGNAWETFVATDLVRTIDARFRVIARGDSRGLGGLSEGGYGALNIGLHHPGEFRVLQSWSGYMRALGYRGIFGDNQQLQRYDSPADTVGTVAPQLRDAGTYIWFYSGAKDPLRVQNLEFSAKLSALGIPHQFFIWPGTHNWAMWRALAPWALTSASEHLGHG